MYFHHDRIQLNAYDHLLPPLLSDFPADLRIVEPPAAFLRTESGFLLGKGFGIPQMASYGHAPLLYGK